MVTVCVVYSDKMAAQYMLAFMFLTVTFFGEVFGINCTVDTESQVGLIVLYIYN